MLIPEQLSAARSCSRKRKQRIWTINANLTYQKMVWCQWLFVFDISTNIRKWLFVHKMLNYTEYCAKSDFSQALVAKNIVRSFFARFHKAFPHSSKLRNFRQVEVPLDALLRQSTCYFVFAKLLESFLELSSHSDKFCSTLRDCCLRLTCSCN